MNDNSSHISVMLNEAVAALLPHAGGIYIDGTFGRGGYSRALLETADDTVVYGIDRDAQAILTGQELVQAFTPRFKLLHGLFGNMDILLSDLGITAVDGVVLDLGVSSPQLDDDSRGFSFRHDGPLDMRMGLTNVTAADIVNSMDETTLANIIFRYGEERYSRRVARRIVAARQEGTRITRTAELAAIVRAAVPRSGDGIDPATRTFQALRIAVNGELDDLERGLAAAERVLRPGGRLAVVSFHSLEDRLVKDFMRSHSADAAQPSRHTPAAAMQSKIAAAPTFQVITRKPLVPTDAETTSNPRARSARLRIAERTDAPCLSLPLPSTDYVIGGKSYRHS